ncbi:MAG: DUF1217 domain-containing protein [Pseudomonadota bacterium]
MTFQPVVPFGGYSGWQFLNRTLESQKETFNASAQTVREVTYFSENIGEVTTAEELVADRNLLSVALGAYGLDDDIDNRFFIQKVLEDGTLDPDALGNRLADKRYLEFSRAFGFGDSAFPSTLRTSFSEGVVTDYLDRQFEIAVGNQDENFRLAFVIERDLAELSTDDMSDDAKWFTVMGNPPLRAAFETALGLPSSFVSLDLEDQLKEFRDRLESATGDGEISQFSEPEQMENFVRLFLLRAEATAGISASTPGAGVLSLLSGQSSASNILQIISQS